MKRFDSRRPLSSGSRAWIGFAFALSALGILLSGAFRPAYGALPPTIDVTTRDTTDTLRIAPRRLFERRVLFSREYLNQLLYTVWRANETEPPVVISPPDEQGRAAAYARKYKIDEALALQIINSALAEGIDPDLGFRLVRVESVFRPRARGPAGAMGLTQLMFRTALSIDRNLQTEAAIFDPETNLRTGFRYLRTMIEKYDGDVRLGLLAYNRGPGTVDRALRLGQDPGNGYSRKLLRVAGDPYTGDGLIEPE